MEFRFASFAENKGPVSADCIECCTGKTSYGTCDRSNGIHIGWLRFRPFCSSHWYQQTIVFRLERARSMRSTSYGKWGLFPIFDKFTLYEVGKAANLYWKTFYSQKTTNAYVCISTTTSSMCFLSFLITHNSRCRYPKIDSKPESKMRKSGAKLSPPQSKWEMMTGDAYLKLGAIRPYTTKSKMTHFYFSPNF